MLFVRIVRELKNDIAAGIFDPFPVQTVNVVATSRRTIDAGCILQRAEFFLSRNFPNVKFPKNEHYFKNKSKYDAWTSFLLTEQIGRRRKRIFPILFHLAPSVEPNFHRRQQMEFFS